MLAPFAKVKGISLEEKTLLYENHIKELQEIYYIPTENEMELINAWDKILISKQNYKNKIAILGYKSDLVGCWDPCNTLTGLPGSEEAVVYVSEILAQRGWKVTIFMNPPEKSLWRSKNSNPQWLPDNNFYEMDETYDLIVCWRIMKPPKQKGKIIFYWSHDYPTKNTNLIGFDGILALTNYHQNLLQPYSNNIKTVICGNGAILEQFEMSKNKTSKISLGYFSNYLRGLSIILEYWSKIRLQFPNATLSICYGRETWSKEPSEQMKRIINYITFYKNQGIKEYGKLGHQALADVMKETSIWTYPCIDKGETFCITAIKAQLAGCIPITTRIGALEETVAPKAPSIPYIYNAQDKEEYIKLLLSEMERISKMKDYEIDIERNEYKNFAKKYSWNNCVDVWENFYKTFP